MLRTLGLVVSLAASATALAAETVLEFRVGDTELGATADDIAAVEASLDSDGALMLRLRSTKARAFGELTMAHIGWQMQVLICGAVVVEPIVREAIVSGNLTVTNIPAEQLPTFVAILEGQKPCAALTG